ncbi:hypothetical protein BJV77DRAFT_1153453 [Russula vinacea]|nr:hypothetical protein BJV77DRAFT_1153453 [Russula vinacea]
MATNSGTRYLHTQSFTRCARRFDCPFLCSLRSISSGFFPNRCVCYAGCSSRSDAKRQCLNGICRFETPTTSSATHPVLNNGGDHIGVVICPHDAANWARRTTRTLRFGSIDTISLSRVIAALSVCCSIIILLPFQLGVNSHECDTGAVCCGLARGNVGIPKQCLVKLNSLSNSLFLVRRGAVVIAVRAAGTLGLLTFRKFRVKV